MHTLRIVLTLGIAIASAASCGGSTFSDKDGSSGGSSSSGGPNSGGSNGKGGSQAKGGSVSSGGFYATGGSGGTGTAGTGASGGLPAECLEAQDPGPCRGAVTAYWHNPDSGVCEPFVYGGCEGNSNRFESLKQCLDSCNGGMPNLDACQVNSDCMLLNRACCGCGEQLTEFVAINKQNQAQYSQFIGCTDVLCEPCLDLGPTASNSGYFVATCHEGQCMPVDIRMTAAAKCDSPFDCILRAGAGCCEGCGGENEWIAVSDPNALMDLVCDSDLVACDACAPEFPPNLTGTCLDSSVCGVAELSP